MSFFPELIFGLVGPLGTDLTLVADSLVAALDRVRYIPERIRLSQLMRGLLQPPWSILPSAGPFDESLDAHMTAGNDWRERTGRGDAMALLGMSAIRKSRFAKTGNRQRPAERTAYILHSLKRPEEVQTLRRIYGAAFFLVAAYAPHSQRVDYIAQRIADSKHANQKASFISSAHKLIDRDENEIGQEFGQNAQDTFSLADVIVDATDRESMGHALQRFVEIVFGQSFHTPSIDEQGMFIAHGASYRSASLARQVGAAICRKDGSVISVGSNEVARAGGGQYWPSDESDQRDFRRGHDTSAKMKKNLLADILNRLKQSGWLNDEQREVATELLVERCLSGETAAMKGAQFLGTIDFVRAVHAEMAAMTEAARYGVATDTGTLYTTTFPCHDCAKHIVASGIDRVVYVEPYPKSLVPELHGDSIDVDSPGTCGRRVRFVPFVGVAPNRYGEFFKMKARKGGEGQVAEWSASSAAPHLPQHRPDVAVAAEVHEVDRFAKLVQESGLELADTGN